MAFPAERVAAGEARRKEKAERYESPHHPDAQARAQARMSGRDMQTNYSMPAGVIGATDSAGSISGGRGGVAAGHGGGTSGTSGSGASGNFGTGGMSGASGSGTGGAAYYGGGTSNRIAAQPMAAAVQIPEGQIPVVVPSFTTPVTEVEAVPISLPSNYAFYDFKALYVRPFRGYHLSKLSRAHEEGSLLYTAETVSSVLSTPEGHANLAFQLTVPDFYYILYWLRINSYTKTSYLHTSSCTNEQHLKDVVAGTKLVESLKHTEIIKKGVLEETFLTTVPDLSQFTLECQGVELKVATMKDAIEMTDHPNFIDADFRFLAEKACYIRPIGNDRMSLVERCNIVMEMSAEDIETILAYEKAITEYGVKETLRVTCKGCGTVRKDTVVIDVNSFFH